MHHPSLRTQRGVTLVELAIVLVIIGLVIGGVLTGQSLLRSAELRAMVSDYDKYAKAAKLFKDVYDAPPGDFSLASTTWVGSSNGDGNTSISNNAESFQFWQHLAAAELIDSTYSGTAGAGGAAHAVSGTNVPGGSMPNSAWSVGNLAATDFSGLTGAYAITSGNYFLFGRARIAAPWRADDSIITPEEAQRVDTKNDDGNPITGRVIAYGWNGAGTLCTTATIATSTPITYLSASTVNECGLMFVDAF
jgi:prepilin-type N-terminal cleavage/methylation domain-containing protein